MFNYYLSVGDCDSAEICINLSAETKTLFKKEEQPSNNPEEEHIGKWEHDHFKGDSFHKYQLFVCRGQIDSIENMINIHSEMFSKLTWDMQRTVMTFKKRQGLDKVFLENILLGIRDNYIKIETTEKNNNEFEKLFAHRRLRELAAAYSYSSFEDLKYIKKIYLEALDSMLTSEDKNEESVNSLYVNIGDLSCRMKEFDEAIIWYNKYLGTYSHVQNGNRTSKPEVFSKIGNAYLQLKRFSNADSYFEQVISDIDKIPGFNIGKARLLGDCLPWFLQKKDFPRAITTLQKGVFLVNGSQQGTFNPQKVAGKETVLPVLYAQIANAYNNWYVTNKQAALLDSALLYSDYAMQAFGLACNFSDTYDPEQSLDFLNEDTRFYFEEAIRIRLIYAQNIGNQAPLKESFQVCERCKAV